MTARMGQARPLADVTEKQWDHQIWMGPRAVATRLGWLSFHVLWSRGSRPGFPDRVAYRERLLFAEMKTEKGAISDAQIATLTSLAKAGQEVYLWRPSDLDEAGRVLANRWTYDPVGRCLYTARDAIWTPRSLWTVEGCRADQAAQMRL